MHTAKVGKKGARKESTGDIDIAMRIERAKKRGEGTGPKTRDMGTIRGTSKVGTEDTTATASSTEDISCAASVGSMAKTGGMKGVQLSRAGRLYDR